jgi:hypothetical protein
LAGAAAGAAAFFTLAGAAAGAAAFFTGSLFGSVGSVGNENDGSANVACGDSPGTGTAFTGLAFMTGFGFGAASPETYDFNLGC